MIEFVLNLQVVMLSDLSSPIGFKIDMVYE